MANNQAFRIKNGLSAKRYLQSSTAVAASDVDMSLGSYFTKTLSANTTFTFSNPPASGKAMGFALEVTGGSATVGYDLANAAYDSVNFDTASQGGPFGLVFKSDGTKMYVLSGFTPDSIYQYSLSTAWDLSTASYDSVSLNVSSQDADMFGMTVNSDGTSFYTIGDAGNSVYQYNLTTAWDLSTASYSQSFSVGSQETAPRAVEFNSNGTKMYSVGSTNLTVYQYSLSTAYDISTASYDNVSFGVSSQGHTSPTGLRFNSEGTKMYIASSSADKVSEYTLTTAYDLSTASYNSLDFSLSSQDTNPYDIFFKPDGAKMYMAGATTTDIYQYSTVGTSTAITTWPSSVKWSGATAPDAPASGEKDVYVFVTTDGGTTYYGKQAGDAVA